MNDNDFKVIYVFNFLISIQSTLKRAQVEVSMTKLNKLYIYRQKNPWPINESPLSPLPIELKQNYYHQIKEKRLDIFVLTLEFPI